MIKVVGVGTARAGWQAGIALGRLVKSGVVEKVFHSNEAKAAWGHSYQITFKGLGALGVVAPDDDEDEDDPFMKAFTALRELMPKLVNTRRRVSPTFINSADNREVLRLGVAGGWLQMTITATPDGVEWLAGQGEATGKAGEV
jgi:hypothetical protein